MNKLLITSVLLSAISFGEYYADKRAIKKILIPYKDATGKGDALAERKLGLQYRLGIEGVELNYEKAMFYFKKAANQGEPLALYQIGSMYSRGEGVELNHAEAAKYFKKSADLGYPTAMAHLALLYQEGEGVEKDINKAIALGEKAASQGHELGYIFLGNLYARGMDVKQDLEKAKNYFKHACDELHYELSCQYLRELEKQNF
jgi:TPR repeat protein